MDSEVLKFIGTIVITLLVAGGDQFIKSIKKKAARGSRAASRTSAPKTRSTTPPPPPVRETFKVQEDTASSPWDKQKPTHNAPLPLLSQLPDEGERITEDVAPMESIPADKPAVRLSLNDDLKKAFIWSEILKRKF